MHALATVLATRLELADEQLDYASEWRAETPLDGLAAENAREDEEDLNAAREALKEVAEVGAIPWEVAKLQLAERAADWQVP